MPNLKSKASKEEKKDKEDKVKIKKDKKPFICKGCRNQFGHDALVQNPAGVCPECGGPLRSKVIDDKETVSNVRLTKLGGK